MPLRPLLAVVMLATASRAAGPFPFYEFPSGQEPDLDDGSLDDWLVAVPGPSATSADLVPMPTRAGPSPPPGSGDLSANIYLGWSASLQRIYIAVDRLDDRHVGPPEGWDPAQYIAGWVYDGVVVMLDGDHSGGQYRSFWVDQIPAPVPFVSTQTYEGIPDGPVVDSPTVIRNLFPWVVSPPWAAVGGWVDQGPPARSVIEFYVTPWDSLKKAGPDASIRSTLEVGRVIGFEVYVLDFDTEPRKCEGHYSLTHEAKAYEDADLLADGLLIGCSDDATRIDDASWGEVKGRVTGHAGGEADSATARPIARRSAPEVSLPDFDDEAGEYHGYSALAGVSNTWRLAQNSVDLLLVRGECCSAPPGVSAARGGLLGTHQGELEVRRTSTTVVAPAGLR